LTIWISKDPFGAALSNEAVWLTMQVVRLPSPLSDVGASELEAYFTVSGEDHLLRVFFHHVDIFHVIDDVHLPLEEHGQKTVGHVPNYFAYRVEGSPFRAAQREVLAVVRPGSTHYRFVTGGNCLDVISPDEPSFSWVS